MSLTNRLALDSIPDTALWIEARGMLLNGRGTVLDLQFTPELCGAVFQEDIGLGVVIGKPEQDLLFQLSELTEEILCPIENSVYVAAALPQYSKENALLMQLPASFNSAQASNKRALHLADEQIVSRKFDTSDFKQIENMPDLLREELEQELRYGTTVYCVTLENRPVSFCFPASKSESLWDISIDTLLEYRNMGLAKHCALYAIAEMREQGLEPVWGVVESNLASRRLAAKLGFEEVCRLAVFTRED